MNMSIKNRDMKTDMNRSQKKLDVFWDDCIKEDPFTNNTSFKFTKKNSNNSTNKSKNKKKINYKRKIPEERRRSLVNVRYKKLCEKIPNLYEEEQSNISKNKKIQNSIKRSILLYSYGLEVQKANKSNISKSKMIKEQEELKLCTWKPKITDYKTKSNSISSKYRNKMGNKTSKNSTKRIIDLYMKNECTFRPKINENPNISLKKIFNKSKSVTLYTDRDNTSFLFRYKKARDEYMIKKFKRLSEKDESYDTTFVDLTSRVRDKGYKYYLNVNNNIQINDEKVKNNNNDYSNIYFNILRDNYNSFSITNSNANSLPKSNKSKNYYVGLLKEQLRLIDLEL